MKRILRFFGYVPIIDLLADVEKFDSAQSKKRKELTDESALLYLMQKPEEAKSKFMDGLEEGWQGIGAMRFLNEYLATSKTT